MPDQLPIDDWERVVAALERFDAPDLTVEDGTARLSFDRAHLHLSRDGRFDAGMPLHDVDGEQADTVVVDHEAGTLSLVGDTVEYTFRRPDR
jgi:hypothetical protein